MDLVLQLQKWLCGVVTSSSGMQRPGALLCLIIVSEQALKRLYRSIEGYLLQSVLSTVFQDVELTLRQPPTLQELPLGGK